MYMQMYMYTYINLNDTTCWIVPLSPVSLSPVLLSHIFEYQSCICICICIYINLNDTTCWIVSLKPVSLGHIFEYQSCYSSSSHFIETIKVRRIRKSRVVESVKCVVVCSTVLQCVAVCCSVLQCV